MTTIIVRGFRVRLGTLPPMCFEVEPCFTSKWNPVLLRSGSNCLCLVEQALLLPPAGSAQRSKGGASSKVNLGSEEWMTAEKKERGQDRTIAEVKQELVTTCRQRCRRRRMSGATDFETMITIFVRGLRVRLGMLPPRCFEVEPCFTSKWKQLLMFGKAGASASSCWKRATIKGRRFIKSQRGLGGVDDGGEEGERKGQDDCGSEAGAGHYLSPALETAADVGSHRFR